MELPPNKNGYLFIFSTFEKSDFGTYFVEVLTSNVNEVVIDQNVDIIDI